MKVEFPDFTPSEEFLLFYMSREEIKEVEDEEDGELPSLKKKGDRYIEIDVSAFYLLRALVEASKGKVMAGDEVKRQFDKDFNSLMSAEVYCESRNYTSNGILFSRREKAVLEDGSEIYYVFLPPAPYPEILFYEIREKANFFRVAEREEEK